MRNKLTVRINFAGASAPRGQGPVVNEEVRASLEAVRASRRSAQRRIWRARGVALGVVGLGALGVMGLGRLSRPAVGAASPTASPPIRAQATAASPAVSASARAEAASPAVGVQAPLPTSSSVRMAAATASISVPVAPPPTEGIDAADRAAPTAAPVAPTPVVLSPEAQACAEAFARHRWNTVLSSCTTAYEQRPDAEVALWLAQAHHRQARVATAGVWAERTIALDDQRPEAFILLARAALQASQREEAARAYLAYLALAPQGWHAREARAAAGWRPLP